MKIANTGTVQAVYTYGKGLISMNRADANSYYHFDGLGSVMALSDNSGGIVEKYSYNIFGEPNRTSSINNPYFFTGRQYDSETGNYYYRARYYKPSIGRFLQPDPIEYVDGMNLYTYVKNNPTNLIDPFGLIGIVIVPPEATCRQMAQEETAKEKNNPDNYMRHCVTSCNLAKRAGKACAWAAGWAHELRPKNWSTFSDAREDLRNNATGRGCSDKIVPGCPSGKSEYKSCEECCAASK